MSDEKRAKATLNYGPDEQVSPMDAEYVEQIAAALKAERERARDVALTAIRSAWEQQCAGYEALDNCESCRAYDDAILTVEYRFRTGGAS